MDNLIIHLETIISLIGIFWVIIFLPWLVGKAANKYIEDKSKESYYEIWGFGLVLMLIVFGVALVLNGAYIIIFSFYNH